MNKKFHELFQNVRANPKKTAKIIYDIALEYSKENKDYDISIYKGENVTEDNSIILSFLSTIDKSLSDQSISTKFLSKVVEHISTFDKDKECCETSDFYVELAARYLRELYITSEDVPDRVECHEKAISNIHMILIEKDIMEKKQNALINELKDNLSMTLRSTSRRNKKIVEMSSKLKEKDIIDNRQNELLDKLDKNLVEKEQIDNLQNELINNLRSEIEKKSSLDEYQSELIEKMQRTLLQKEEIDSKQSSLLLKIREELIEKEIMDLEQSQSIYKLETIIANHQTQINSLSKKIDFLDKFTIKNDVKFSSTCIKVYILFAICVIFNILTVIYMCLIN